MYPSTDSHKSSTSDGEIEIFLVIVFVDPTGCTTTFILVLEFGPCALNEYEVFPIPVRTIFESICHVIIDLFKSVA